MKLRLTEAAKWYKGQPHQLAAFNWLEEQLSAEVLEEFAEMFRAAPAVKSPLPPPWLTPALKIIREFEGLRLEAYKCPAGIPTIGYGTTRTKNGPVRMGQTITQQEADELLAHDVEQLFGPGVLSLLPLAAKWSPNRIAALVSFAYNLGLGALEESTLRKRLLAGEDPFTVVREEFPRWVYAGEAVLPGLERRRAAEVALFCSGAPAKPSEPPTLTPQSSFSAKITPNIRLGEFALDQKERQFTQQHQIETAMELANFMERVRRNFHGMPVIITSGYRPPAINKAVGGAKESEHLYSKAGEGAVDFYLDGADINAVQQFCDKYWPYSVGYGAPKGFVHLGRRADGKHRRWVY